jgi:alpha-tubulin suppressor-like RCC1 family protein
VAWFVILLFGLILGASSIGPVQAACGGSPVVVTDKPDYGPTETVVISGSGFQCGEELYIVVIAPDGSTKSGDGTGAAGPDTVITDDNGAFSLSYHLSGTLADGSVYEGQLGIYRVEVRDGPGTVLAQTNFSDAFGDFSCALTVAGGVKCWGDGATPVDVTGLASGVIQITLGDRHACALTTAGGVKCWGDNFFGQLGNGTFASLIATPVDVSGLTSGVAQISAGGLHTCAVTTGGGAKCWGANDRGQLGNGTSTASPPWGIATPGDVIGLTSGVAQIIAGLGVTCALTTAGGVKCWGNNSNGELGNGTFTPSPPGGGIPTPVDVSGLTSGVAQISNRGQAHICAVTTGGGAKCWGANERGQLGNGTFTLFPPSSIATPVDVSGLTSGVAQISGGQAHTCALTTGGGAKCWGDNVYGELGNGTFTGAPFYGISTPVNVSGLTSGVAQISAGINRTCALTTAGGVKCWGYNRDGQLGNGTFTASPPYGIATPGDVIGLTSGVAALWDTAPIAPVVPWTFSGFYHPVEMGGVWNSRKGGSTVPLKFQVFAGSAELTDPSIVLQPLMATQTPCSGGPMDTIELTPTGGTSLRYDTDGGHFIYNWKTPKMPGYCYTVTVTLTSGASLSANFELR